jgi:hypothetical protein
LTSQLVSALQAANKIKIFQLSASTVLLMNVPVSYIFLRNGFPAFSPFLVSVVLIVLYMIPQIIITKKEAGLPLDDFFKNIARLLLVTFLTFIVPLFIHKSMNSGMGRFILVSISGFFTSIPFIWTTGLEKIERDMVIAYIQRRMGKK